MNHADEKDHDLLKIAVLKKIKFKRDILYMPSVDPLLWHTPAEVEKKLVICIIMIVELIFLYNLA